MTPEQSALVSKALESLAAARVLTERGFQGFASARAYYAMYYVAQALLLAEGVTYSKHSAVIAAFGQRLSKTGKVQPEFHRYLIQGAESRNIGDYGVAGGLTAEDAAKQISRAESFLDLAERLLGPLPPPELEPS